MKLVQMLKNLFAPESRSSSEESRVIVILQRKFHQFGQDELRAAAERGWNKTFDGNEDPMYFVLASDVLTVVKAGPYVIRVTSISKRYVDDDEYVLSQLPQPEQKKAWSEHYACTILDLFNDLSSSEKKISDLEAYSSMATLALQLGDSNCAAIYMSGKNIMMPNDGAAEQGLRVLIDKKPRMKR